MPAGLTAVPSNGRGPKGQFFEERKALAPCLIDNARKADGRTGWDALLSDSGAYDAVGTIVSEVAARLEMKRHAMAAPLRILDATCFTGVVTRDLIAKVHPPVELIANDVPELVALAQKEEQPPSLSADRRIIYTSLNLAKEYSLRMDKKFPKVNLATESFDAVLLFGSFRFSGGTEEIIRAVYNLLAEGGIFAVIDFSPVLPITSNHFGRDAVTRLNEAMGENGIEMSVIRDFVLHTWGEMGQVHHQLTEITEPISGDPGKRACGIIIEK